MISVNVSTSRDCAGICTTGKESAVRMDSRSFGNAPPNCMTWFTISSAHEIPALKLKGVYGSILRLRKRKRRLSKRLSKPFTGSTSSVIRSCHDILQYSLGYIRIRLSYWGPRKALWAHKAQNVMELHISDVVLTSPSTCLSKMMCERGRTFARQKPELASFKIEYGQVFPNND